MSIEQQYWRSIAVVACLLGLVLACQAAECNPDGSGGFPACAGLTTLTFSAPDCQGSIISYNDDDSPDASAGECVALLPELHILYPNSTVCDAGFTFSTNSYFPTSDDPTGSCTQPIGSQVTTSEIGLCMNTAGGGSQALVCNSTMSVSIPSGAVASGPIISSLANNSDCSFVSGCIGILWRAQYDTNTECSGAPTSLSDVVPQNVQLDVCYEYQSPVGTPYRNVKFTYDGALFHTHQYTNGCDGRSAGIRSTSVGVCFKDGSSSYIYTLVLPPTAPTSNTPPQESPEASVPSSGVPNVPETEVIPSSASSGGTITLLTFTKGNCSSSLIPIGLTANISLCQAVVTPVSTDYVRADCYSNDQFHGAFCGDDSSCSSCTAFPEPTASGSCMAFNPEGLINSIKAFCYPPSPSVPLAVPQESPYTSPTSSGVPTHGSALCRILISAMACFSVLFISIVL